MSIRFTRRRHETAEYWAETGLRYMRDHDVGTPAEWWVKHPGKPWERIEEEETAQQLENAHAEFEES